MFKLKGMFLSAPVRESYSNCVAGVQRSAVQPTPPSYKARGKEKARSKFVAFSLDSASAEILPQIQITRLFYSKAVLHSLPAQHNPPPWNLCKAFQIKQALNYCSQEDIFTTRTVFKDIRPTEDLRIWLSFDIQLFFSWEVGKSNSFPAGGK